MSVKNRILSERILAGKIFSDMWFSIPAYQRPYIWGYDQISDLLDDLAYAQSVKPDQEYFLGSFVYQAKKADPSTGCLYDENDLLDGQQRMTTLLILFACIRDMSDDADVQKTCLSYIYQEGNRIRKIPERTRMTFAIRDDAQRFLDTYIKNDNGTSLQDKLKDISQDKNADINKRNMAAAVLVVREYLKTNNIDLENFIDFITNNVLMIYVATENLDDAFRLFTILNDRGIPLRNSDILKSHNLGELKNRKDEFKYAKFWEEAESELGEDFDRFLNYIRTILVKEKARTSLLDEFEYKIYKSREIDKNTGLPKMPLLEKGVKTFEYIKLYLEHYKTLIQNDNFSHTGNNYMFDNLLKVMITSLPSTDWVPPLLRYYEKFGYHNILEFLVLLDNKFSVDWIVQYTPTVRIENMNKIIRAIESAAIPQDVITHKDFDFDKRGLIDAIEANVYDKRHVRYLLLKLDYLYQDDHQKMNIESLSVEHILPRNPDTNSQWIKDFTDTEREEWQDKLGNLVLITTRKNSSQGRKDFVDKKRDYFKTRITTCPNSLRVMSKYNVWTMKELKENQKTVVQELGSHYKA